MVSLTSHAWRRPLPDRSLKLIVVGIGLGFWLAWGIAIFFLVDGHPLNGMEGCGPVDNVGIFWECASDKLHTLLATTINGIIILTLAMPVFVAAANIDPVALPLAMPGLMFNVFGLPAGMFVLVRSLRRLVEKARA
ncbi:MAG: hypothetical protein AAF234_01435 [Pseudomonadota bacterium]